MKKELTRIQSEEYVENLLRLLYEHLEEQRLTIDRKLLTNNTNIYYDELNNYCKISYLLLFIS